MSHHHEEWPPFNYGLDGLAYHYGGLTTGEKCAGHTVTRSVLTTVTYRPNSPVTRVDMTCSNHYNSIHLNEIITTSQVSYWLSYKERYITA